MFRSLSYMLVMLTVPSMAFAAYPEDSVCAVRFGQVSGTGFVVGANDKELLCLGAAHVVPEGAAVVDVVWENGVQQTGRIAKIDRSLDALAFTVPNPGGDHLPLVIADTKPENGPFSGVGFGASGREVVTGQFAAAQPAGFAIKGTNALGTSGGPVFDQTGQVAGQMVGSTTGIGGKTLAISGQQLQRFVAPFVGGVVPIGDLKDDPSFRLTALRTCNHSVTVAQPVQRAVDNVLDIEPRFNFARFGRRIFNGNDDQTIAQLENEIIALRQNINLSNNNNVYAGAGASGAAGQPGPAGKDGSDGKDGADGQAGQPGKDATFDYARVWQWLKDHKDEFPVTNTTESPKPTAADFDAWALEIQKRLPPQKLEWTTLDGKVLKQEARLGTPLKLQTVKISNL